MIAELRKERAGLVDQLKQLVDEAEGREQPGMTEEESDQFDAMQAQVLDLDDRIQKRADLERLMGGQEEPVAVREQRMQPERKQAPTHIQRPTGDNPDSIMCRYIRTGDEGAAREMRASNDTTMNITTDADGGYLVPTGHYQRIVERARPRALPFLLDVMNIPGKGTTVNVPVDNEADTGVFVSTTESNEFDRDAPAVSQIAMALVMYTKRVDLTYQLLDDEDSNLMAFLENYVAAGYAATLNNLMVTEALADGTSGLTFDSATVIAAAEVPELFYKLSAEYARGNIAWLAARATEGEIYSLASSSIFTFTNQPQGNSATGQTMLWGTPLYTDANMGATAASAKSLIVADWGYMGMRLSPGMTLIRDPYTRSSYGEIRLNYHFRADFEVLQAAAFQYGVHPSA